MSKVFAPVIGGGSLLWGIIGFFLPESAGIAQAIDPTIGHNLFYILTGLVLLGVSNKVEASKIATLVVGVIYTILAITGLFTSNVLGILQSTLTNEIILWIVGLSSLGVGLSGCNCSAKNTD